MRYWLRQPAATAWLLTATPLLAQSGDVRRHTVDIFFWLGVIIVLVAVVVVLATWLRRRVLRDPGAGSEGIGLLAEMERLHGEGQISDAEYARFKQRLAQGATTAEQQAANEADKGDQALDSSDDNRASGL